MSTPKLATLMSFALVGLCCFSHSVNAQTDWGWGLSLSSPDFTNGGTLPVVMANNIKAGGVNSCTQDGGPGGDQSPALVWRNPPFGTRTYAIVAFDATASFTHWAMYNIPGDLHALPQHITAADTQYGRQVYNDFGKKGYGGPCPPIGVAPTIHHYIFTLYALDAPLSIPRHANFPSTGEAVYLALVQAGQTHHLLGSAQISGYYSATPATVAAR